MIECRSLQKLLVESRRQTNNPCGNNHFNNSRCLPYSNGVFSVIESSAWTRLAEYQVANLICLAHDKLTV